MVRAALAAAVVVAAGGEAVVVGSTALRLRGAPLAVRDLDLVPPPHGLERLWRALPALGVVDLPPVAWLRDIPMVSLSTSYGPVDVFTERGRTDHARLLAGASVLSVDGVPVTVASAADAWELRRRFKDG